MAEFLLIGEFRFFYANLSEMYIRCINYCIYAV